MTTEEKIFEAAFRVFQLKGFKGARMQEIADEAGINKAMLHYCFKNKELLFEAVFMNAFGKLAPQINEIFKSQDSIFEKIKKFEKWIEKIQNVHRGNEKKMCNAYEIVIA